MGARELFRRADTGNDAFVMPHRYQGNCLSDRWRKDRPKGPRHCIRVSVGMVHGYREALATADTGPAISASLEVAAAIDDSYEAQYSRQFRSGKGSTHEVLTSCPVIRMTCHPAAIDSLAKSCRTPA